MIICNNCGNSVGEGVLFCTECGGAVPSAARPELPLLPTGSQWDSTLVAGAPLLTANHTFAAVEITPASRPKNGKLSLIIVGIGVLVIAAAVLLLVLKPFSNKPPALGGIEASQLMAYAGDRVSLTARATDPNGDKLTYNWMASAGELIGDGPMMTLSTAGVDPDSGREDIRVHVTVSDGHGGTASADQTVTVRVPKKSNLEDVKIKDSEIEQLLEGWKRAWESSNLQRYSDFYDESFSGRNYSSQIGYQLMTRTQWMKDKEQKFRRSGAISITFGPTTINYDGNDAIVSFTQAYQSGNYADHGDKTLYLRRKPSGEIKIIREDFVPAKSIR